MTTSFQEVSFDGLHIVYCKPEDGTLTIQVPVKEVLTADLSRTLAKSLLLRGEFTETDVEEVFRYIERISLRRYLMAKIVGRGMLP